MAKKKINKISDVLLRPKEMWWKKNDGGQEHISPTNPVKTAEGKIRDKMDFYKKCFKRDHSPPGAFRISVLS